MKKKRQIDVSRGKLGMDASPQLYKESQIEGFFFLTLTLKEKGCHHVKNLIYFIVCLN